MVDRAIHSQEPSHRTIMAVDIEGFGDPARDDPGRVMLRASLDDYLTAAFERCGVDPAMAERSDLGDGYLLLVEPGVSKLRLLHAAGMGLAVALARHNQLAPPAMRLRLRVVLHAGELLRDTSGWAGEAIITAFRLLDAQPVRHALRASDGPLALVVSGQLYDGVVKHGYGLVDPARYVPIEIEEKETRTVAWLHLPAPRAVAALALPGERLGPARAAAVGHGGHAAHATHAASAAPTARAARPPGGRYAPARPGEAAPPSGPAPASPPAARPGSRWRGRRAVAGPGERHEGNDQDRPVEPAATVRVFGDARVGNLLVYGDVRGDVTVTLNGGSGGDKGAADA